jgi:aryl-alcohol dehydrogenase-like predicted oxidoreductase
VIEQVRLGTSGLHVSRLGLGMMSFGDTSRRAWVLDEKAADPIVRYALACGITFFDTADMYAGGASELVTGRLLRTLVSREEVVVATKVFYPMTPGANGGGLSRKHILAAIDASLHRLGLDYVDLYQIHRWDEHTPIEETMEALHDIVRAGKARYLGASTMAAWQFAKAQAVAEQNGWTRFVSMQNHYNLLYREEEREMIPLCRDQGVGVIPYSPLARGLLARVGNGTEPTARAQSDPLQESIYGQPGDDEVISGAAELAQEFGVPIAQLALAWILHNPAVTAPIIGATRTSHIDDAAAATRLSLTPEQRSRLERAYLPHRADNDTARSGSSLSSSVAEHADRNAMS